MTASRRPRLGGHRPASATEATPFYSCSPCKPGCCGAQRCTDNNATPRRPSSLAFDLVVDTRGFHQQPIRRDRAPRGFIAYARATASSLSAEKTVGRDDDASGPFGAAEGGRH
ncbi:hypothetical protein MTO96_050024 [Rhipicephalus appendiculatus]